MNRPQLIIFGAIGLVAILAVLLITGAIPGLKELRPEPFTLTVWGFDEPELWGTIGAQYRETQESATVAYLKKDRETHEAELLNALAAGSGPDVFLLENGQLGKHGDKIQPLADGALNYQKRNLKNIFADAVAEAIADADGALLGTPLIFDTLALFYNRDYLNAANIPTPPRTWEELVEVTRKLTRLSSVGGIERSGIALGTASNVEHAADILLALIYQAGGSIIEEGQSAVDNPTTARALSFYGAFANATKNTYAWNAFFENSLTAFARGDAAMAIGYAADIPRIVAQNPQLNFDAAPLPQARDARTAVNFGRFDLYVVSRTSRQSEQSWRFLLWLQGKEIQKTYADARGLPPARRDLAGSKPPRDYLIPFYDGVLSARTAPAVVSDSLGSILGDMIEAVATRRFTLEQAIRRAHEEIRTALTPAP